MRLALHEQETVINYNRAGSVAYIYTCDRALQRHIEKKLGYKPLRVNSHGCKDYEIPKSMLRRPQKPRRMSEEQKGGLRTRLKIDFKRNYPHSSGEN